MSWAEDVASTMLLISAVILGAVIVADFIDGWRNRP
jgi:hypothetical protein